MQEKRASAPFNRCRRLSRDVIYYATDPLDLIDDPRGYCSEKIVRKRGIFAGHKIRGADGTKGNRVIVGPEIPDNADRPGIGQHSKILVCFDTAALKLIAELNSRVESLEEK